MAIIYPSANGNWSDTSLWMEVGGNPYNKIPQVDDVVYLNGCQVAMNTDINIGNGEIRNDGNDGQGIVAGGTLTKGTTSRTITSNIQMFNQTLFVFTAAQTIYTLTINGNIELNNTNFLGTSPANACTTYVINGNLSIYGDVGTSPVFHTRNYGTQSLSINGDVYSEFPCLFSSYHQSISVNGNIVGDIQLSSVALTSLTLIGNTTQGDRVYCSSNITTCNINGSFTNTTTAITNSYITTLNLNGTLTQGQGQIASYITTLNLDGTLNLSGTRPFTTGVQNLNVATGGSVTYDNHLYYCFTNIVAVDSNFTITCRNQNLDNFDFKNKNLLNNTYPAQANVSDGYVYGLEYQFTGSYQLPPESVVLEGTPYGSHVGTLTLDISSSVQDTIDDIEDEVNILVDSYPPLVTLESITNIGNTSATINLSVSNTALITKTGAEVDTDWNFSNPYEYEVNNWATSVNVTGLNPSVQYYVRGYVIYDGKKVYSSANTLQTLLVPPELQLCEYLRSDGSAYIQTDAIINDITYINGKFCAGASTKYFFGAGSNTTFYVFQQTATVVTFRIGSTNNQTSGISVSNTQPFTFSFDAISKKWFTKGSIFNANGSYDVTAKMTLFRGNNVTSNSYIYKIDTNLFNMVSTYVKTGETYTDNKGNTCSAGTAGLYDILTQTFYTNDGGGNFTHGNDIL